MEHHGSGQRQGEGAASPESLLELLDTRINPFHTTTFINLFCTTSILDVSSLLHQLTDSTTRTI